jgi:signal transduction histidine kinase
MIDYAQGPLWLTLIIAFVTEVIFGPRWVSWVTVAAGYVALLWGPALAGRESTPSAAAAAGVAAWVLVLLAVSTGLSLRRERRAERREAQESESRRLVSDERLRIARELHDVLAHNISLINVQAGVALHLIDEHPEQGKIALQTIKDASKDTLRELRSVLGVLRQVDEDLPLAPAPSLERLDELLERAEAVGMTVHAERTGEPRPLPAGIDLAAYRILQESLTNVAKHAGPATVTITLVYGARELSISVEDDGTGGAGGAGGAGGRESPTPGGNGIAGMRERATALGGSLQVGRRPGGGYQVKAVLPLGGER